jgi:cell division protein FtsL
MSAIRICTVTTRERVFCFLCALNNLMGIDVSLVSCQTDVLQFVAEVAKRDEAVNEFKYRHVPELESLDLQLQVLLLSQP